MCCGTPHITFADDVSGWATLRRFRCLAPRLGNLQGVKNPLNAVAKSIADRAKILFFDEFLFLLGGVAISIGFQMFVPLLSICYISWFTKHGVSWGLLFGILTVIITDDIGQVLLFEYLGEHGFNKVPVIIKDYSIQLDPEVDYVPVHYKMKGADTVTYVPTSCFISINMSVSYTPKKLRKQFDIKGLTTGAAYSDGFI